MAGRGRCTRTRSAPNRGAFIGRDWINRHQPWQPYSHVDIEYEIHYPKKPARADPDNLAPTVKHLVDGLTDAGLWADDDYQHLRRRTYTMGPPTRTTGLWRVSIHITPLANEETS